MSTDHAWTIERGLLGGLLLDPTQIPDVGDVLAPRDFHRPQHGALFAHLTRLITTGPVDVSLVLADLARRDALEESGGASYIAALPSDCPSVENIPAYAARVRESSNRRMLRMVLLGAAEALDDGEDLTSVIEHAETRIADLRKLAVGKDDARFVRVGDIAQEVIKRASTPPAEDAPAVMITTGFPEIDRRVVGFSPGDLIIVAARSGMGKTAFALNLSINMARAGFPVAIHSSEMTSDANVRRMLCAVGRASAMQLKSGRVDDENLRRLILGAEALTDLPIAIDDRSGASLSDLRARLSRLRWEDGQRTAVLVIDYLQLLRAVAGRGGTRENEVSGIARGLKELGKELGLVVVALSQISRGVEQRGDKRPGMADLRESGEIEQAADAILLLYRDDYYNPESANKGICEAILAKLREGRTGTVPLAWLADYLLFQTLVHEGEWKPATAPPTKAAKGRGRRDIDDPDEDGSFF